MGLLTTLIRDKITASRAQRQQGEDQLAEAHLKTALTSPDLIPENRQQLMDQAAKLWGVKDKDVQGFMQRAVGVAHKLHGAIPPPPGMDAQAPQQAPPTQNTAPPPPSAPNDGLQYSPISHTPMTIPAWAHNPDAPGYPIPPPNLNAQAPASTGPVPAPVLPPVAAPAARGRFSGLADAAAQTNPTQLEIATENRGLTNQKELSKFRTNEDIRQAQETGKISAKQADEQREKWATEITGLVKSGEMTEDEGRQARLHLYGVTPAPETFRQVDVQTKNPDGTPGDWVPAMQGSRGSLTTLDKKPINVGSINDVRANRPEAPKASQEVTDLALADLAKQGANDPRTGKPFTPADKAALAQRKKQLDDAAKKQTISINNMQAVANAGQTLTDDELKALVRGDMVSGTTSPLGMGQSPLRARYLKAKAQLFAEDPEILTARAAYKAGSANLAQLQKLKGATGAFEDALQLSIDTAKAASEAVPRSDARKFNTFTQMLSANLEDNPPLAQLRVATQTAINEYARLVTNGQATDAARAEGKAILDGAMGRMSYSAALDTMKREALNRVKGIDNQIEIQKKAMGTGKGPVQGPAAKPGNAADYLRSIGHQ